MVHLEIRFPAGRYHATPWGRHVNEGAVEWPPSPWRLLRAFLATGFNRLGWTEVPDPARALVEKLGAAPPCYRLPAASTSHTRHYMPQLKEATALVFDSFAYVGTEEESALLATFEVELTDSERRMLEELVSRMTYLGRAESWVDVKLQDTIPPWARRGSHVECVAAEVAPCPERERIPLLAPLSAPEYEAWREGALVAERGRWLEEARGKAESKGKKAPASLSKKEAAELEALFPVNLVEALRTDTRTLQKAGWSQPPGSRWLSYWVPLDALSSRRPARPSPPPPRGVTTALFALAADTAHKQALPLLKDAVLRAEALHKALVKASSDRDGGGLPSPCFTASAGEDKLKGHQHAALLPLGLDERGRIDHVLIHCPMGFDAQAWAALGRIKATWVKGLPKIYVTLVGHGTPEDFEDVPQLGEAATWRSYTPFVAPRYVKPRGRNTLESQIREELEGRGFPSPCAVEVEVEGERYVAASQFPALQPDRIRGPEGEPLRLATHWRHFRKERIEEARKPPAQPVIGLRIRFDRPVQGPLTLGYGSHFGLGQFVPEAAQGRCLLPK